MNNRDKILKIISDYYGGPDFTAERHLNKKEILEEIKKILENEPQNSAINGYCNICCPNCGTPIKDI